MSEARRPYVDVNRISMLGYLWIRKTEIEGLGGILTREKVGECQETRRDSLRLFFLFDFHLSIACPCP